MVNGVSQAGLHVLPCFSYCIQHFLNDAIFEKGYAKDLKAESRQKVGHFNHVLASFSV